MKSFFIFPKILVTFPCPRICRDVMSDDDLVIPSDSDDSNKIEEIEHQTREMLPDSDKYYESNQATTTLPFMPSSTKEYVDSSKYLCWNAYGTAVLCINKFGEEHIDLTPSAASSWNASRLTNQNAIIAFTLDDSAYVKATRTSVTYHNFEWYNDLDDITQTFSALDSVELIALGSSWFAVATSSNRIHIFGISGFPIAVFALPGKCISMVGHKETLFIIHSNNLMFEIFDVDKQTSEAKGLIGAKHPIRWTGFDIANNTVYIESGDYKFYALTKSCGAHWVSMMDMTTYFNDDIVSFFPSCIEDGKLFGIGLHEGETQPSNKPLPEWEEIEMQPIVMNPHQSECLKALVRYAAVDDKDEAAKDLDKELLKQLHNALIQNRHLLATQIVMQMKSEKGRKLAIQLADRTNNPSVAERIQLLHDLTDSSDADDESESESPVPYVRTEPLPTTEDESETAPPSRPLSRLPSVMSDIQIPSRSSSARKIIEEEEEDVPEKPKYIRKPTEEEEDDSEEEVKSSKSSKPNKATSSQKQKGKGRKTKPKTQKKKGKTTEEKHEEEEEETEEKPKAKKTETKKPIKKKPAKKKLFKQKPTDVPDLSKFGFSIKK